MNHGIVRFSALGDRMDADYHLALASVQERVERISMRISREEASELLSRIPTEDKRCLRVLRRGEAKSSAVAERDYPFLSLALLETQADQGIERIRARISQEEDALQALLSLEGLARAACNPTTDGGAA